MQFSLRAGSVFRAFIGAAIGVVVLAIGIVRHKMPLDIGGVVYIVLCVALWYRRRNGGGSQR